MILITRTDFDQIRYYIFSWTREITQSYFLIRISHGISTCSGETAEQLVIYKSREFNDLATSNIFMYLLRILRIKQCLFITGTNSRV